MAATVVYSSLVAGLRVATVVVVLRLLHRGAVVVVVVVLHKR
jgi:hypothetical protein